MLPFDPGHAVVPPGARVCFHPRSREWTDRSALTWRSSDHNVAVFQDRYAGEGGPRAGPCLGDDWRRFPLSV